MCVPNLKVTPVSVDHISKRCTSLQGGQYENTVGVWDNTHRTQMTLHCAFSSLGTDSNSPTLKIQFHHSCVSFSLCVCVNISTGTCRGKPALRLRRSRRPGCSRTLNTKTGSFRATCRPGVIAGWRKGGGGHMVSARTRVKRRQCRQAYDTRETQTPASPLGGGRGHIEVAAAQ